MFDEDREYVTLADAPPPTKLLADDLTITCRGGRNRTRIRFIQTRLLTARVRELEEAAAAAACGVTAVTAAPAVSAANSDLNAAVTLLTARCDRLQATLDQVKSIPPVVYTVCTRAWTALVQVSCALLLYS